MVSSCCVQGCRSESYNGSNVSLHLFPKNEDLKKKWIDVVPGNIKKHSTVCSLHFKAEDFLTHPIASKKLLKVNAVPSIFSEIASYKMNFNVMKVKDSSIEYSESKLRPPIAMVAPELKQNADDQEITKTCAVLGCEDSKNLGDEEFFRFPEDPSQRQIWTNLTGRNNWTPTDYSYICIQHFSVDCFECDEDNQVVLNDNAVPSVKLPGHVFEVEYIDEDSLDNDNDAEDADMVHEYLEEDIDMPETEVKFNGNTPKPPTPIPPTPKSPQKETNNMEIIKLFSEVQHLQRKAVGLREKLKINDRIHKKQNRFLNRLNQVIEIKQKLLLQKKKKKSKILLSLQDKIRDDANGLVMAMPMKHTEDLKNFALSVYKYSPQGYVYIRNTLRTMLPSTEILDSWVSAGFSPKNVLTNSNMIKVVAEQTETELTCKVSLR